MKANYNDILSNEEICKKRYQILGEIGSLVDLIDRVNTMYQEETDRDEINHQIDLIEGSVDGVIYNMRKIKLLNQKAKELNT